MSKFCSLKSLGVVFFINECTLYIVASTHYYQPDRRNLLSKSHFVWIHVKCPKHSTQFSFIRSCFFGFFFFHLKNLMFKIPFCFFLFSSFTSCLPAIQGSFLFNPIMFHSIFIESMSISLNISVLCSNLLIFRNEHWRYTFVALYMDGLSVKLIFMSISDMYYRKKLLKKRRKKRKDFIIVSKHFITLAL